MTTRAYDGTDSELGVLLAWADVPDVATLADVAAAGRAAWTWRGVDEELDQLLRRHAGLA